MLDGVVQIAALVPYVVIIAIRQEVLARMDSVFAIVVGAVRHVESACASISVGAMECAIMVLASAPQDGRVTSVKVA
jgi:hypothetical protein